MESYHFEIDAVYEDYLECRHVTGDGTEINSTTQYIAKPPVYRGDLGTYAIGDIILAARSVEVTGVTVGEDTLHWEALHEPLAEGGATRFVGETFLWWKITAPPGFHICEGGTIGNASSGASVRANADQENLFTYLWDADDAFGNLTISGGKGASAAADWAANKTITLPDIRRRYVVGRGSSTFSDVFGTEGEAVEADREPDAHTHSDTKAAGNESAHTHGVGTIAIATESSHTHDSGSLGTNNAGSHNHTGYTGFFTVSSTTYTVRADQSDVSVIQTVDAMGHSHSISSDGSHGHSVNSGATGAGSAHTHSISGDSGTGTAHTHTITGSVTELTSWPPRIVGLWVINHNGTLAA